MRAAGNARALGIFVRAPIAGRVKTRLAAEIGPRAAAQLYSRLGRHVVSQVLGGDWATTVWFAPPDARALVRAWLESGREFALEPQAKGPLGARLAAAFARHFAADARRVVLIGSDCPGIDRRLIRAAFGALEHADLVLGPSEDGGYYLIGLTKPAPALFAAIPWSTPRVLARTRARARGLGLSTRLLARLRDVDTAQDARSLGLIGRRAVPP